jgi:hypothetical protein
MPFITQGKTNWKLLLIVIILAVIVGGGAFLWYLQENRNVDKSIDQEQTCINSGGTITTSLCCEASGDFPSSCMIGACGCSPNDSHEVKTCDCGVDRCFDGAECAPQKTTGDETADWKTYRDEEYKYEVKYPNDWIYLGGLGASAGSFNIKPPVENSNPYDRIESRIFPREGSESNQEYIDNVIHESVMPGYMDLISKKEVTFNNLKGYELIWKIKDIETNKTYEGPIDVFFETPSENKARFITFIFAGEATQNNPNFPVFYKVLSTFKFIGEGIKLGKVEVNYEEIKTIQQSVDEGHQPWRLNPVMVLRSEIFLYGFNLDTDYSTLYPIPDVATQEKFGTEITEVNLEITHNGKVYIITLIQPITGPNKVWTISDIELK